MLTDKQIKNYKNLRQGGREILWDIAGLGLRIGEKKTWVFRYSFQGRQLMTLGTYPAVTLKEARAKAAKAALDIQHGINPLAEKKAAKEARKIAPTIEEIIKEFHDIELIHKKSGKKTKRLLEFDVVPKWKNRKVADIKRRDIVILLDSIKERGAPVIANRVQSALSRLFNFAAERGIIDDSPCTRIRKGKETAKNRFLSDEEINLLWEGLSLENKAVDIYRGTKLAIKMILLTGCRPGEVAGMTWDELTEEGFWNIPAERMKGNQAHRVPLCNMATEVIEAAKLLSGDSPYIFRSTHKDSTPLTTGALSLAVARHREEMGFKEPFFTPHDLRRTLRTKLAELGIDDVVAERVLGHKLQGVLGIYNRHPYDKEKRQALTQWENRLRLIVGLDKPEMAKIINIGGAR